MVIYHNSAKDSNNKPRWNRIETAQKIIDFNKISKNTAIYAIFFTLRLAVLAATPLRKLLQNKDVLQPCGCLSPNTWMESLSLREDFAANNPLIFYRIGKRLVGTGF